MLPKDLLLPLLLIVGSLSALASDDFQQSSACLGQADGTLLNIQDSCTSYIHCKDELPITVYCSRGWAFSASQRTCVQYAQSDCADADEYEQFMQFDAQQVNAAAYDSSTEWMMCVNQPDGTLLSIDDDCQAYVYCLSYIPMKIPCLFGMGYNSAVGGCVKYSNSDCVASVESGVTEPAYAVSTTTKATTTATCDNEQRPENQEACAGQAYGTLVPYPGDCAKFLVCMCEYPTVKNCAAGTWFDNTIKTCNYPQNVDCPWAAGSSTTQMPTTTTTEGTTSTTTTTETTTTTTTSEPTTTTVSSTTTTTEPTTSAVPSTTTTPSDWGYNCEAPPGMDNDICWLFSDGYLISYPYNCNAYINCTQGCPVMTYCPADKVFNPFLLICDTPETADCVELPMPSTTTITTALPTQTTEMSTTAEVDTTTDEISSTTSQDVETTTEEPDIDTTLDWGNNCEVPPGMESDICWSFPDGFLISYPYNCNAYINCTQGCPVMNFCPADKVFNPFLLICDTPETAECVELPMPSTTTTELPTQTTEMSSSTAAVSTTTPQDVETTTEEPDINTTLDWGNDCEAPAGMGNDICWSFPNGFLISYPYNCNAYINCTQGCPVMNFCPVDKVFNPFLLICDTPETAECVELPMPSTTTITTALPTQTTEMSTTTEVESSSTAITEENSTTTEMATTEESTTTTEETTTEEATTEESGTTTEETTTEEVTTEESTTEEITTEEPTSTTRDYETSTTDVSTTTATDEPPTTPGNCTNPIGIPQDYCEGLAEGSVLLYPYNCSAYISCRYDCPYLEYCDADKLFNWFLGICDDPNNVECLVQPFPTPTTPTPTTTANNTTPELDTTTAQPPFTPTLPPSIDLEMCRGEADYSLFPYEENCHQYIMCMGGEVELRDCPNGWLYNYEMQMCDDTGEEVCYTASSTTPENTEATTTTAEPILELCVGQEVGTSFPYPEDCQKYYYCRSSNGQFYILMCPYNNYYDPISGNCGPDVSATACQEYIGTTPWMPSTTTEASTLSPEQKCAGQEFGNTFPYEPNCQQYIMCTNNGDYKLMNCPGGNYYYPESGNCGPSEDEDICRKSGTSSSTMATTTTTSTSSTTTPSPTLQGVCGNYSNGELIEYPHNCHKYISCVRPIPIGFYCPANLYFNVEQQICSAQPAEDADCSTYPSNETTVAPPTHICQGMTAEDTQIYPFDCQMYYQCLGNGYYMLQICNQGEYFNPLNHQCSSNVDSNYCRQDFETTTPSPSTTTTSKPSQGICWNKPNGYRVPYPNDCSKYIVCDTPVPTGYYCPVGLQFSSEAQTCVEPKESDCGVITTTTEALPTMPWNQCSGKTDYTLLPNEEDCSEFIVCIHNLEHVAMCPAGQYFDVTLGNCSSQAQSDACIYGNTSTTTDGETMTTEVTSTTSPTTTTTTTTSTTTTPKPNMGPCYGQPVDSKVAYPNNCAKYIVCHDPIPEAMECPAGLEFNSEMAECVRPELANCSIKTTTEAPTTTTTIPTTTQPPNICADLPTGSTITYPWDCSKYYMCLSGNSVLVSCMPNTYYNPLSGQCDSSSATMCQGEATTDPCYDRENGYTFSYTEDCSKFYLCLNETAYVTQCPKQTYYNPQEGVCDAQATETECQESTTTTEFTTNTQETTTEEMSSTETTEEIPTTVANTTETTEELPTTILTTTELPTTSSGTDETTTSELTTTTESYSTTEELPNTTTPSTTPPPGSNPQNNSNICCGQESGTRLPYPGDNTKYVICLYPVPEVAQCLANSIYDPTSQTCQTQDNGYINMPSCATVPFGQGLPYEGDCTKYYQCFGTMAKVMTCDNNWYFNADLGSCVPSQLYACPWDIYYDILI
ncbi:uncharacterized protein [Musca autumnalis]|uniref:uncharacterized protein n=1 Tax=Musca autumnalis TaxID=221902 RepID=UPI003CE8F9A3